MQPIGSFRAQGFSVLKYAETMPHLFTRSTLTSVRIILEQNDINNDPHDLYDSYTKFYLN